MAWLFARRANYEIFSSVRPTYRKNGERFLYVGGTASRIWTDNRIHRYEKPNAVLNVGDVYDRAVPSVEAVRLFDDFLTDLAAKEVTVILISGNHDSPERLNYAGRLLSERKIHLCGVFDGTLCSVTLLTIGNRSSGSTVY
jgi:hypothetical protein